MKISKRLLEEPAAEAHQAPVVKSDTVFGLALECGRGGLREGVLLEQFASAAG